MSSVKPHEPCDDTISRQAAIDALWKALYDYEDKTQKQFQESKELDVGDWIQHRIFVQNMNDIDRQTILELPPVTPQPKTDVLDEIKAEIKQLPFQRIFGNVSSYSLLDTVVEIIDKYREEQ